MRGLILRLIRTALVLPSETLAGFHRDRRCRGEFDEELILTVPFARPWMPNYGIQSSGLRRLVLENDELRITLLPGKGSDVIQFFYKPLNTEFMWASQPGLKPAGAAKPS